MGLAFKLILLTAAALLAVHFVAKSGNKSLRTSNLSTIRSAYKQFLSDYNIKRASPEEDQYRFAVFTVNYNKIQAHNADESQTYELGVTQYADVTQEEFASKYLMNLVVPKTNSTVAVPKANAAGVDWRTKGGVSPVKNQGSCGSCWAFSTTATIESAYRIFKNQQVSLSEQQLVDCSSTDGYQCQGCSGCWPEWSFKYVADRGIQTDKQYPYTARAAACKSKTGDYKIASYQLYTGKDDTVVAAHNLNTVLSVCVDASNWSLYKSGIFSNCGTQLNHAVTLVGHDSEKWIVKNSWGSTGWGQQGYIFLSKTKSNTCGISSYVVIPTL